jgi:glycosyltransferase involved in cell wall biosynthesis
MRIAYLLSQYPLPTQTFAQSDISALRQLGQSVDIFTVKPRRAASDDAQEQVHRPSWRGALRWPGAIWRCRQALPDLLVAILPRLFTAPRTALMALACLPRAAEIADLIVRERYDVAHLFWARHAGLVLTMLKRRKAPALRSVFVGAYDLVAGDFIVALAIDAAEIVFSHAEANRTHLQRLAPPHMPVAIIRRGIPLMDHSAGIVRDPHLWVTASALVPEKNIEAVVRMFVEARQRDPRLRLEVYGEGPHRSQLEAHCRTLGCEEHVSFCGHVARAALFAAMQRAGVFLLLSKKPSERLPNVVKEAMFAGCFVVSSNSEGIEELLPDAALGLIINPDDPVAMSSAAGQALWHGQNADPARAARARDFIARHFAATGSMAAYRDNWDQMIHARPVPSGSQPDLAPVPAL